MAQEQNRASDRLEHRQRNIQAVARKTEAARTELVRIESDEKRNRTELEKDKALRSAALDRLNREIKTQKERYDRLVKNEKELSGLIAKIDRQIPKENAPPRSNRVVRLPQRAPNRIIPDALPLLRHWVISGL